MTIEKELLQAINLLSQGKEEGFNDFYSCTYNYVYSRAKFIMKNEEDALDLTQETFLRFLESSSYKDTGRPLAYLYTIARNLCIEEFRRVPTEELKEEIEWERGKSDLRLKRLENDFRIIELLRSLVPCDSILVYIFW